MNGEESAMPVRQFATKKLIGVAGSQSIVEACRTMVEFDIGSVVVVTDRGNVVGFVTKSDIVERVVAVGLDTERPVADIMSDELVTMDLNAPVGEVMAEMEAHQLKNMLLTERGEIVGIFTFKDFHDPRRQYLTTDISSE